MDSSLLMLFRLQHSFLSTHLLPLLYPSKIALCSMRDTKKAKVNAKCSP
jgi:hypothetical protein